MSPAPALEMSVFSSLTPILHSYPLLGPHKLTKGDPENAKATGGPTALPAPVPPVSRCVSCGRSHHCLCSRELACLLEVLGAVTTGGPAGDLL